MTKKINSRNSVTAKAHLNQKATDKIEPERVVKTIRKSKEIDGRSERRNFDDTAEMFRGLFDGNEHYHSRDSSFVALF